MVSDNGAVCAPHAQAASAEAPAGLWWVLPGVLAGMRRPRDADEIAALRAECGVGAIVSVQDDAEAVREYEALGVPHLWLPVRGGHAPTEEQAHALHVFVRKSVERGQPVALHCSSGRRRTGTMIAAYLLLSGATRSADAAVQRVLCANPAVDLREPQVNFLRALETVAAHEIGGKAFASHERQLAAEFVGTALLVATVVGSGIQGDALSVDDGVALLGNTIATWGILYMLISVFGPISGAHFNPIVSLAFYLKRELELARLVLFTVAQVAGGICGTFLVHAMFDYPATSFDGKPRNSGGEFVGEIIATFGLLVTIFGFIRADKESHIPMGVGLYITAGYWFTSSTSFANPAVTIARTFTDTFASIEPASVPLFITAQVVGLVIALPFIQWMFFEDDPLTALRTLIAPFLPAPTSTTSNSTAAPACLPPLPAAPHQQQQQKQTADSSSVEMLTVDAPNSNL